ncbi:hypothetical protein F2P81_007407 [Scophthalmus maximus]|uniref:Uncharacterized protein n=1 Tax=Scophthalmus maximus TaxID=52904 RepID=A0A6A4T9L7_SCOMX|nr:hypothetical protein F2P81_007407 [Scophthalmus maximus]
MIVICSEGHTELNIKTHKKQSTETKSPNRHAPPLGYVRPWSMNRGRAGKKLQQMVTQHRPLCLPTYQLSVSLPSRQYPSSLVPAPFGRRRSP